jgi:hypothetical protein
MEVARGVRDQTRAVGLCGVARQKPCGLDKFGVWEITRKGITALEREVGWEVRERGERRGG